MVLPADTPSSVTAEPTIAMVERAAGWRAHLESGDATPDDRRACKAWQDEHPAHALAFARLGALGDQLSARSPVEHETLRRLFPLRRRQLGRAMLGIAILIGAGMLAYPLLHTQPAHTDIGETETLALDDGSHMTLATDTVAHVAVKRLRRHVRLDQGEILIEVAHDPTAPFLVETSDGTARALGTAFTVRKDKAATLVSVIASRVEACPASRSGCLILRPGERAKLTPTAVARLSDIAPEQASAWAHGWLQVDDQPLAEVLDDLNRWRKSPIRYDRAQVAGMRVSGIYPLSDTDRALTNIARLLPIQIERSNPASPVVKARRK